MKQCNSCKRILDEKCFSKNKNHPDGLSYYCRACTKKKQDLHLFMQDGKEIHEQVIIDELKKHNIPLKGVDKDKLRNLRVTMYDYPGVMRSLLIDLPIFLKKYNLTYEEYKTFIALCHENKFWIESKHLNT